MTEPLRRASASPAWRDKPILANDQRQAKQHGLSAFLDRLRQLDFVTGIETLQYHPTLIVRTDFVHMPGDPGRIEGWFSTFEAPGATRFELQTDAVSRAQQQQYLADLRQWSLAR